MLNLVDYRIAPVSELENYLYTHGRNVFDCNMQLPGNKAFIYKLENGEVIALPGNLHKNANGILFSTEPIFRHFLDKDSFPVSNETKVLEEDFQEEF